MSSQGAERTENGASSAAESGRTLKKLGAGIVLGLVVYAALALWGDARAVGRELSRFPWELVPLACGLSFLNYVVRFARWERYRTRLSIRLPRDLSFLIHLAGLSLTVSPGKMGEAFKSWLVRRVDGTPLSHSAPIVVAERFTDLVAFLALIAIGGLATQPERAWLFWATGGACALLLIGVAWRGLHARAIELVRARPRLARFAPALENALASTRTLLAPRELPLPILLATGGWFLECVAFWLLASAQVDGGVPLSFAVYTFALAAVAGAVAIFFPGGLGITEASLSALLVARYAAAGVEHQDAQSKAVVTTLVIRLCTLWFAVALGVVATLLFERRMRRRSEPASA